MRNINTIFNDKSGNPIRIQIQEDADPKANRTHGWAHHQILAHRCGEIAGYLKILHLDKQKFTSKFPTPDDLSHALKQKEAGSKNDVALQHKRKFYEYYIKTYVDKPRVEFIKVYGAKDLKHTHYGDSNERLITNGVPQDHTRQGIGLILYASAAAWAAEKGIVFRSGIKQSNEAQNAWQKMKREKWPVNKEMVPRPCWTLDFQKEKNPWESAKTQAERSLQKNTSKILYDNDR